MFRTAFVDNEFKSRCLSLLSSMRDVQNVQQPLQYPAPAFMKTGKPDRGARCEFARGNTTWSIALHMFLLQEVRSDKPGCVLYKGFTPTDAPQAHPLIVGGGSLCVDGRPRRSAHLAVQ